MNTFRIHFKNGNSITVTAHHFGTKTSSANIATVPFYKDETNIDESIMVFVSEVAAIVPEPQIPFVGAGGGAARSSSGVRSR